MLEVAAQPTDVVLCHADPEGAFLRDLREKRWPYVPRLRAVQALCALLFDRVIVVDSHLLNNRAYHRLLRLNSQGEAALFEEGVVVAAMQRPFATFADRQADFLMRRKLRPLGLDFLGSRAYAQDLDTVVRFAVPWDPRDLLTEYPSRVATAARRMGGGLDPREVNTFCSYLLKVYPEENRGEPIRRGGIYHHLDQHDPQYSPAARSAFRQAADAEYESGLPDHLGTAASFGGTDCGPGEAGPTSVPVSGATPIEPLIEFIRTAPAVEDMPALSTQALNFVDSDCILGARRHLVSVRTKALADYSACQASQLQGLTYWRSSLLEYLGQLNRYLGEDITRKVARLPTRPVRAEAAHVRQRAELRAKNIRVLIAIEEGAGRLPGLTWRDITVCGQIAERARQLEAEVGRYADRAFREVSRVMHFGRGPL